MPTEAVETALAVHEPHAEVVRVEDFLPLFSIENAVARQKAMSDFIGHILHEGSDYGVIPGTSKQKVLLKPGAEKLCSFFGLSPRFIPEEIVEDWSGNDHQGEPLFYFRYKCQLYRGERFLAEAVGSCNSREKKYRYRSAQRACPMCGKTSLIKTKRNVWWCVPDKGGCNENFKLDDPAVTKQELGQVLNPDVADAVNTIQKMAQKRALVAAVLIGTNASDSFTQDIEESAEAPETVPERPAPATQAPPQTARQIPEELMAMFANLDKDPKHTAGAFKMMEDALVHAGGANGVLAYAERVKALRAAYPKGKTIPIAAIKDCLLDLFEDSLKVLPETEPIGGWQGATLSGFKADDSDVPEVIGDKK